jgi:hypothetical protein
VRCPQLMQYGEAVTRAFTIIWRFKYLWLLAILGGAEASSGGFNPDFRSFNGLNSLNRRGSTFPDNGTAGPSPSEMGQQFSQFLQDNAGALILIGLFLLILVLAWFLLSCITTGALIRASAEHDAERPFGFGLAWRAGLRTFWSILRLALVGLLWGFLSLLLLTTFVVLGFVTYTAGQQTALIAVITIGILVTLLLILASIIVGIVFTLARRAIVLEQRGPLSALGRGFRLLQARLGRVLLVWLIQVGLQLAIGVGVFVVTLLALIVAVLPIVVMAITTGPLGAVLIGIPIGFAFLVGSLLINGIAGSYISVYWTLAFRRLELEPQHPTYATT